MTKPIETLTKRGKKQRQGLDKRKETLEEDTIKWREENPELAAKLDKQKEENTLKLLKTGKTDEEKLDLVFRMLGRTTRKALIVEHLKILKKTLKKLQKIYPELAITNNTIARTIREISEGELDD